MLSRDHRPLPDNGRDLVRIMLNYVLRVPAPVDPKNFPK